MWDLQDGGSLDGGWGVAWIWVGDVSAWFGKRCEDGERNRGMSDMYTGFGTLLQQPVERNRRGSQIFPGSSSQRREQGR